MLEDFLLESLIGNVTPVELAWTAGGLTGIWFGLVNVSQAWQNLESLNGRINGRRVLANRAIRREAIKGVIFALAILLGVLASLAPSPPVRSETALVGSLILIVILGLLVLDSILDHRDDKYLLEHGITSRDERGMTADEAEDEKFGIERRGLRDVAVDEAVKAAKDNEGD